MFFTKCVDFLRRTFTRYNFCKAMMFWLTFFSYALLHANRKSFSNVKPTLQKVWTEQFHNQTTAEIFPTYIWRSHHLFSSEQEAKTFLGILDAVFMFSYAIGLYINGYLGDIFKPRLVLGTGMVLSAVAIFVFGVVTEWVGLYNVYFYGAMYALNGLCQSAGWPAAVTILGAWIGHSRGFWMGAWSGCASVGNILGDLMTGSVLDCGYEIGFLVPAAALLSGGIVVSCGILDGPWELEGAASAVTSHYQPIQDDTDKCATGTTEVYVQVEPILDKENVSEPPKMSLCSVILIPGVIFYGLAYACLKLVNYAFFFWLTEYMTSEFHWSNALADQVSIWYDVGGIVGGIVTGLISDLMWSRSPVTVASLVLTVPALFLYRRAPSTISGNAGILAVVGFFIGGPANLISSAISADLGSTPLLSGNKGALSTVTGFIDGTGSVGAALGQLVVSPLSDKYGWGSVFIFFMVMIGCTVLMLMPVLVRDVIRLVRHRRHQRLETSSSTTN